MIEEHRKHKAFITLTLLTAVALSCRQPKLLFEKINGEQSGIHFINTVSETDSLTVFTYPYLFNGAGVAVADFNNDGLQDVFFSANQKSGNKFYLNKGDFKFEDVTVQAGVNGTAGWSTGVATVDINSDGWMDIYVSTVNIPGKFQSTNELFLNDRNGHFTESASRYGLDKQCHTTQSLFFDYDRDGDLDCFLLNHAATYTENFASIAVRPKTDSVSGCQLLRNDRDSFTNVTVAAGIWCGPNQYGLGIGTADLNNDGWPDLYVSNDFKENDFCYFNNRDGTFTDATESLLSHVSRYSMGNDLADYNNDGWTDILSLDMLPPDEQNLKTSVADDDIEVYNYKSKEFNFHYQFLKNCLQQNVEGKAFCDVSLQKGIASTDWSWAPLFADFNNDGKKDLFVSNGYKYRTNNLDFASHLTDNMMALAKLDGPEAQKRREQLLPNGAIADYLFLSGDDFVFTDVSKAAGFTQPSLSSGAAYADLDNDGDLDLVVNRINEEAGIYKNESPAANYLSISLNGNDGNSFGIGATVYAYASGNMQCYAQSPVRGFMSSVSPVMHIGLGTNKTVDSLIILWPDGSGQRLQNLTANQRLVLKQSDAAPNFPRPVLPQLMSSAWADATDSSGIGFIHHEDEFDDLNVQPLLPHSLATQGPKLTVGDVNGDGLQDFYVCGAKGQAGALYTQTAGGKFVHSTGVAFAVDSTFEDTDALFFDADGDKDLDLYVCSGGNEYYGHDTHLPDRLYINDAKGDFIRSNALPEMYENKSCVRSCDFDKDGDADLFVGGRANARMFGYLPASVILKNNGGIFTEATAETANGLSNVGMVTDACWSDVNGDGWMDLLVVGEWMAVTVFKNERGKLIKQSTLQNSTGLWQCIVPADVDGDGDTDFLLGNRGSNTKLTASSTAPLKLFIADWDGNGDTEPILATGKAGNYYPFYGKTDLERRLPFLKKRFLKYADFAGKTVEEIFTPAALSKAQTLQVQELKSCVLFNNGGNLQLKPFPYFLQTAPVFSFALVDSNATEKDFIAAGNFYEVPPYEGRYDALLPVRFRFKKGNAEMLDCLPVQGPVRQLVPIKTAGGTAVIMARNNQKLLLYKQQKP